MPKPITPIRTATLAAAAACTVCVATAALFSYGQTPNPGALASVVLGIPLSVEKPDESPGAASNDLWDGAESSSQTVDKFGTDEKHSLVNLTAPRNPDIAGLPVASLVSPRLLRELPPAPLSSPISTSKVDEFQTTTGRSSVALAPPRSLQQLPPIPNAEYELKSISRPNLADPSSSNNAGAALAVPRALRDLNPAPRAPSDLPAPPGEHTLAANQEENVDEKSLSAIPLELFPAKPERNPPPALQETQRPTSLQQPTEIKSPTPNFAPPEASSLQLSPRNAISQTPTTHLPDEHPKPGQKPKGPHFFVTEPLSPQLGQGTRRTSYQGSDFQSSVPTAVPLDPLAEELVYRGKFPVRTQRPLVEWGKPLYTDGIYLPGKDWFGSTNLVRPHFMVYGDFRTGVGVNRNASGDANSWANRLNLDMDLAITSTERIHAFMGPLDRTGDFTRLDFTNSAEFVDRTDLRFDTLYFEGDLGSIIGGLNETGSPFDLPFTFGFLPLIYQNGIWAADNVIGAAVALPARHSRTLNWSNYDATFFWASDQVNSDAFAGDNNAAEFFGTAWFIDAYDGYIEADYAFVHDDVGGHRSYHNMSFSFTRRYFSRLSNSVRWITNFGQSLPDDQKTASGNLLLIENSLISDYPNTFVPYCNLFYGQGRPQSLARAGVAGGILTNTGINFEIDGLTGYPTLDATGSNAYGAALGVNLLGTNFGQQLVLELAALGTTGSQQFRNAPGDQVAVGMRYQKPLSNAWLFRTDQMYGWRESASDLHGSRFEFRWKF